MKKTKKIPISFNPEDQEKLKELIYLMGITDVYGDIPKAVKFGINLALSAIKNPEKVYYWLNSSEMEIFFKSVLTYEMIRRDKETIKELQKKHEKV